MNEQQTLERIRALAYWHVADGVQELRTRLACIGAVAIEALAALSLSWASPAVGERSVKKPSRSDEAISVDHTTGCVDSKPAGAMADRAGQNTALEMAEAQLRACLEGQSAYRSSIETIATLTNTAPDAFGAPVVDRVRALLRKVEDLETDRAAAVAEAATLRAENDALRQQLARAERADRSLNEALNMGDGTYRP